MMMVVDIIFLIYRHLQITFMQVVICLQNIKPGAVIDGDPTFVLGYEDLFNIEHFDHVHEAFGAFRIQRST